MIIGHRGSGTVELENTISGFYKAINTGYISWVEFDVRKCKDDLIVLHDETIDRTTMGTGLAIDYNLSELQQFSIRGGNDVIPSLDQVLQKLAKTNVGLNIEIKEPDIFHSVVNKLNEYVINYLIAYERIVISSYCLNNLETVPYQTGYLYDEIPNILPKNKLVIFNYKVLDASLCKILIDRQCSIWCYTIDNYDDIDELYRWGITGFIIN